MKEEKGDGANANARATRAREEKVIGIPFSFLHMSSPLELCDLVGDGD
jgi:hypothetical protein